MIVTGETVVVTGGASGLGGATVRLLAERGAKVAILDINEAPGRSLASETGAQYLEVDVADEQSVGECLAMIERDLGTARILVNYAGVAPAIKTASKDWSAHRLSDVRRAVEINLVGTFNMISQFAARLAAAAPVGEERGVIVNTASVAAFDGQMGQAAYAASKGGIVGLTLPVARDLAQLKIRVMTSAPGIFAHPC